MVSSTPRPHFTPGKDPVPILQEAVWAPGPVCTGVKSRPHRDSILDRPARSQSLYRLSYPAHVFVCIEIIIKVVLSIKVEFGFCTFVAVLNHICIKQRPPLATGHPQTAGSLEGMVIKYGKLKYSGQADLRANCQTQIPHRLHRR